MLKHAQACSCFYAAPLTCISTNFYDTKSNKDSFERAKRDGSFYVPSKIYLLTPTSLKSQIGEGMKKNFLVLSVEKSENFGNLVKVFEEFLFSTGKFKFFANCCFLVIH